MELINRRPTPWRVLAAEVPVIGGLDPAAGWQVWQGEAATWPVTTLPALEAVPAAKPSPRRWTQARDGVGEEGAGFPVVSKDDPGVYDELIRGLRS